MLVIYHVQSRHTRTGDDEHKRWEDGLPIRRSGRGGGHDDVAQEECDHGSEKDEMTGYTGD